MSKELDERTAITKRLIEIIINVPNVNLYAKDHPEYSLLVEILRNQEVILEHLSRTS